MLAISKPNLKDDKNRVVKFSSDIATAVNTFSKEKTAGKKIEDNINQTVSDPLAGGHEFVSKSLARPGAVKNKKEYWSSQPRSPLEWTNLVGGKEFDLLMYLIGLCEKECSLQTPPVFSKDLIELLAIRPSHLRNLILRLTEKGLWRIVLHKSGPHALRIFEFGKDIYTSLVTRKNRRNQNNAKASQVVIARDSLISSNIESEHLQDEFSQIDLTPMEEHGFNTSHIIQIYREYKANPSLKLSEEIIQDSINAMAFDLKFNNAEKDFKHAPAVVLVSLLKKGKPYSSKTPEKFVPPQVEAMRKYLEIKSKEQKEKQELENKTKEIALREWLSELPEKELLSFYQDDGQYNNVPERAKQTLIRKKALQSASDYFEHNVWVEKKRDLMAQFDLSEE